MDRRVRGARAGALARVRAAVQGREAAHELRGLLSTFAATAAAAAARLKTMGAGGQLDEAASTLDGLAELLERLGLQLGELSIEHLRDQAAGGGSACTRGEGCRPGRFGIIGADRWPTDIRSAQASSASLEFARASGWAAARAHG